jgi:ribosomal protein S18 acetylase RimI-like enzyme
MEINIKHPPFGPEFDAIIPDLYPGVALSIKQSQPYALDFLEIGFLMHGTAGQLLGRVAVYNNPGLFLDGKKAIAIGAYECVDDAVASATLLESALAHIHAHFPGAAVVGPMDGSTWQTYRFVVEGDALGPFLFEPFALPYYPQQWQQAGFLPLMAYVSNLAHLHESNREDHTKAQAAFENMGLSFRNLDAGNPEAELLRMAKFNTSSFQSAFLFTAIPDAVFAEKNRRLMGLLDPSLVHVVQEGDEICGMILAYPDKLDPSGKTAVVKTLARLPGARYRGLGDLLCVKIVGTLLDRGYDKMVHALMRADNPSVVSSSKFWGEPYKRYLLFSHSSL